MRRQHVLLIGAVLLVVVAIIAVVLGTSGGGGPKPPNPGPTTQDPVIGAPGVPTVTAQRVGKNVRFTWTYDNARASDTYSYKTSDHTTGTVKGARQKVLPDPSRKQLCLSVKVVRFDGSYASAPYSHAACWNP
jgi:hypothetical protein